MVWAGRPKASLDAGYLKTAPVIIVRLNVSPPKLRRKAKGMSNTIAVKAGTITIETHWEPLPAYVRITQGDKIVAYEMYNPPKTTPPKEEPHE